MLKIAIVDDEIAFVERIERIVTETCKQLNLNLSIDKYSNGFDILDNYKKYHLIFLDIEMPSINGIETAQKLNNLKGSSEIPFLVFVSSHDELVFEALKSFPYSFVRKSDINDNNCVSKLIMKITKLIKDNGRTIIIRTGRNDVVLKVADIIYIEKYKNYSYIYTQDEKYPVKSSLSFYEEMLDDNGFTRCHEGYLINLNNICKIGDKAILVSNGETIPMSRNKVKTLKQAFMKRTVSCNGY